MNSSTFRYNKRKECEKGLNSMEQPNLNEQTINPKEHLMAIVKSLNPIHITLEENSYIKDTTRKLQLLIEDASTNHILLVMGKERVGRTSIINSLLGRDVLPTNQKYPTLINTFIKYGEEPEIRAYFLDGMIASFDFSKLELFTTSDTFIAEILREHVEFIELYITNPFLKDLTIVDSVALELTGSNNAFLAETLLNRVDEILWVVRANTGMSEPEMGLLEKLVNRGMQPHMIVNAIDEVTTNRHEVVNHLKEKLLPFVQSFTAVSAENAIEAKKTNNMQLLIDSQFVELQRLIEDITKNGSQKLTRVVDRLIQWLDIFYIEVKCLLMREPLISARERLEPVSGGEGFEHKRKQRDLAILNAYADEYKSAASVFENVQTLYQLLSLLTKEIHLRDESTEYFEEIAASYQKNVRDYRKMHVDYLQFYGVLDSKLRKDMRISIDSIDLEQYDSPDIRTLLAKYDDLAKLRQRIEELEAQVLKQLPLVKEHLNDLALRKLEGILAKSREVNHYRHVEVEYLQSYNQKLEEFECVEEAQKMLVEQMKPIILDDSFPIQANKRAEFALLFDKIEQFELGIRNLQVELPNNEDLEEQSIDITFDKDYPLIRLTLDTADVISDIPQLPKRIGTKVK